MINACFLLINKRHWNLELNVFKTTLECSFQFGCTSYLKVSAVLGCVLKGPQSSNQAGQLLRHLPRLLRLLACLPLDRRSAGLGLVVGAGGVPDPELLEGQVLGEELGVAQALQDGIHEAGVAVVLEAGDTWHLVAEGEPPAVAVVGRKRPPSGGLQRCRVVLLVLSGLFVGAEMRKGRQSPENSVHEAPH